MAGAHISKPARGGTAIEQGTWPPGLLAQAALMDSLTMTAPGGAAQAQ